MNFFTPSSEGVKNSLISMNFFTPSVEGVFF